ncbi:MAG: sulfotransferase domain-containing protein [Cytophagaceae bacterium]
MNPFFVTGLYRSGTTLLEKLIAADLSVALFSQPCAPLFFHAKNKIHTKLGLKNRQPLDPSFPDPGYSWKELYGLLESEIFTQEDLKEVFTDIRNYSGILTSEVQQLQGKIAEGNFLAVFSQVLTLLNEQQKPYAGSKEILCEEFTPYFISHGIKSIIIVRDPRDMICSLNFGRGAEFTGLIRPLLYSLRLWRKSIAFSILNAPSPDFKMLRYEDLVSDRQGVMDEVFLFLGLRPGSGIELPDSWKGNSSFGDLETVSESSLGNYKRMLDAKTISYIENVCRPEMNWAGYELENSHLRVESIRSYQEPFKVNHRNFDPGYSSDIINLQEEMVRIRLLREKTIRPEEQVSYFLFPEVYHTLKDSY